MARIVSMSFEGNGVKVVEAAVRGRKTIIKDSYAFPVDGLADYLSRSPARDYVVSADFKSSYQEVILLPPVKKGLVKPLLVSEIRKRNPSLEGDIALVYFRTGDKLADGKKQVEYFVFAVAGAEVDELISSFMAYGKRVVALYPNMLAVLKIVPVKEQPYICHYETGNKKNLFLIKGGKVLFTRSAPSIGHGLREYDIQNINMTVNHCRQALRIDPEEVLCIGETLAPNATKTIIPMSFLMKPEHVEVEDDVVNSFLIPISALGKGETQSLFTAAYHRFHMLSTVILQGTRYFTAISLFLVALIGFNASRYAALSSELAALRAQNAELTKAMEENAAVRDSILQQKPLIDFMRRMGANPSPLPLLHSIKTLPVNELEIMKFEVWPAGGDLAVRMSGRIVSPGLYASQKRMDKLVEDLKKECGFAEASGNLVLKEMSFQVDGRYRLGGK